MSILKERPTYPEEQRVYAEAVRSKLLQNGILNPKACVVTYGCQQNVSDSQRIKGMLALMGYQMTEDRTQADFIIFNTCAVREHAEDRVFGNVGATKNLKKENRGLMVAVCGCMAQQKSIAEKIKNSYPYVDILFGTQVTHRLPEFVYKRLSGGKRVFETELENKEIIEDVPIDRENNREAIKSIIKAVDYIKSDKASIGIFPEGYTSLDGELHEFRNGAFKIATKAKAPIVVCTLVNSDKCFKNLIKRRTDVYLDVLKVLSKEEVESLHTDKIGEIVHTAMKENLDKRKSEIKNK